MNSTLDHDQFHERPPQTRLSRFRIALTLAALLVGAITVHAVLSRPEAPPANGKLIDVNGRRVHIVEQGEAHSGPTVVLETGFGGGGTFGWAWVEPEVARFAHVVTYDRAGLGWSEETGGRHDADAVAKQLHATLEQIDARPPFIMVGHSLGGIFVRRFTALYPQDVGALVLIDSVHPEQARRLDVYYYRHPWRVALIGRTLASLGMVSLFGIPREIHSLPPEARAAADYFIRSPGHWAAMSREAHAFHRSLDETREPESFGNLPLIVVSATRGRLPGWPALQRELAAMSTRGEWRAPQGTDHYGLATDPKQSAYTVAAIHDAYRAALKDSAQLSAMSPGQR